MRSTAILLVVAAALSTAHPLDPSSLFSLFNGGSKAAKVQTKIPLREDIPAVGGEAGAKRVRLRYGPYRMPAYSQKTLASTISKEGGMFDAFEKDMAKPCVDCVVTRFKGNMVYADGTEANVNTGACYMTGPQRKALPCGEMIGAKSEPFYTFGNERLELKFENSGAQKAGYYISKDDKLSAIVELMNMAETAKDVFMTIEYEYIPGKPAGYVDAQPMWMAMCELGQVKPPTNTSFVLRSKSTPSPIEGPIILVGGHVHDGGTHVELFMDDKMLCDSVTSYGGRPEFVQTNDKASNLEHMPGMAGMTKLSHISDQTQCYNLGDIKKGQKLRLNAYYDFDKFRGMRNLEGKLAEVMGLGMMYVGRALPSV